MCSTGGGAPGGRSHDAPQEEHWALLVSYPKGILSRSLTSRLLEPVCPGRAKDTRAPAAPGFSTTIRWQFQGEEKMSSLFMSYGNQP